MATFYLVRNPRPLCSAQGKILSAPKDRIVPLEMWERLVEGGTTPAPYLGAVHWWTHHPAPPRLSGTPSRAVREGREGIQLERISVPSTGHRFSLKALHFLIWLNMPHRRRKNWHQLLSKGFWGPIGRCAYGILQGGRGWVGRTLGVAGEHLTGREMAEALTVALGEEVTLGAGWWSPP